MNRPTNLEVVLDKRTTEKGQIEYLVQWKHTTAPSWFKYLLFYIEKREPIVNLKKELEMLADFEVEYEKKLKQKVQQVNKQPPQQQQQQQQVQKRKQIMQESSDEDEEYEVEEILEKRMKKGELQYKVKWKGYPVSESTWEPAKNLDNAKKAIETFEDMQKKVIDNHTEIDNNEKLQPQPKPQPQQKAQQQQEQTEKQTDYNKILAKMTENIGNLKRINEDQPEKKVRKEEGEEKIHLDSLNFIIKKFSLS